MVTARRQRGLAWSASAAAAGLLASCELLGLGAVPCETDANCPEGQVCSAQRVCLGGAPADAAAIDAPAVDALGADTASADASTSVDGSVGPDAGTVTTCETPPCRPVADSRTVFCRLGDTDGPDPCPAAGGEMYGQDGSYLGPQPAYLDLGDGRIADLLTGREWEQIPPATATRWSAARTRCLDLSLGGHDDWRLPTTAELVSLMDYGVSGDSSSLDPGFFPAPSRAGVWTADGYNSYYWTIDLYGGDPIIQLDGGSWDFESRCVRGEAGWQGALRFTAGTHVDRRTGLVWQAQHTADQTLQQALALCEGLVLAGHDDWRVPSLKELETLVDRADAHETTPQTFAGIVDATVASEYWTATPATPPRTGFWTLSFENGRHLTRYRSSTRYLRCVRGP
jgi:hypothetical protein